MVTAFGAVLRDGSEVVVNTDSEVSNAVLGALDNELGRSVGAVEPSYLKFVFGLACRDLRGLGERGGNDCPWDFFFRYDRVEFCESASRLLGGNVFKNGRGTECVRPLGCGRSPWGY